MEIDFTKEKPFYFKREQEYDDPEQGFYTDSVYKVTDYRNGNVYGMQVLDEEALEGRWYDICTLCVTSDYFKNDSDWVKHTEISEEEYNKFLEEVKKNLDL